MKTEVAPACWLHASFDAFFKTDLVSQILKDQSSIGSNNYLSYS